MLIPIRLAPPSSPTAAAAAAAANASTPAKGTPQQSPPSNQQPEEWSLLELNGTLSASLTGAGGSDNNANVGLGGLSLGQLSFAAPDKVRCVEEWVGGREGNGKCLLMYVSEGKERWSARR